MGRSLGTFGASNPWHAKGSAVMAVLGSKASCIVLFLEDMILANNLWSQKYSTGCCLSFQKLMTAFRSAVITIPPGGDTMNQEVIHGRIVPLTATLSCLINVVKSVSMRSQDWRPSVRHTVASSHIPPYLKSRNTLITSLFACIDIRFHEFVWINSRGSVMFKAPFMSSWVTLNKGFAPRWDKRQVFWSGGACFTPLSHNAHIWRGTCGLCLWGRGGLLHSTRLAEVDTTGDCGCQSVCCKILYWTILKVYF